MQHAPHRPINGTAPPSRPDVWPTDVPTAHDPTGSSLSESDWAAWFCRAQAPVELGRLGAYDLLAEIGHGAQGTVYKARQPGTRRDVVIKRLAAGSFATRAMRLRFERETAALAALRHPNIVTVHATEVVDGQPILVMEWVDGQPIDRWTGNGDKGALRSFRDAREILTVFVRVCDAVAHAHQHGIIHRDLKPSNILIDAAGQPRVLDFGLATSLNEVRSSQAVHSRTHGFVGTPAYASPEQIAGDPLTVDIRTDIYSLGVILYELLTGVWPFAAEAQRAPGVSLAGVFDAIRAVEPRRPSLHRRGLGAELDAVLLRAIARDPQDRYQSADAFAADIRRFLAGEPVLAHPPSTLYQLRTIVRRHRAGFGVGAAFIAITLVAAVVSTTLALRLASQQQDLIRSQQGERAQRIAAEAAEERIADEADKVRATNAFLQELLSTNDPLLKLRPDVRLRELLDDGGRSLDAGVLAGQPEVEAAVRTTIGRTYTSMKMSKLGEPHLRRAHEIRTTLPGGEDLGFSEACANLALCLCEQNKFDEGIPLHRQALALHRALDRGDEATLMRGLWRFSTALRDNNELAEAESVAREALEIALRIHGPRHEATAECRFRLAMILNRLRKLDEAETQQREALALQQELLGAKHPAYGESLLRLGQTLSYKRQVDDGIVLMREAVGTLTDALGGEHPNTSRARANLARTLSQRGQHDEAESIFRDIADRRQTYFGRRDSNVAHALSDWASVRVRRGDLAGAEPLMREALALLCADLGDDHPAAQAERLGLADVLVKQGCFAEAETLLLSYFDCAERAASEPGATQATARRLLRFYKAWQTAEPGEERRAATELWQRRVSDD